MTTGRILTLSLFQIKNRFYRRKKTPHLREYKRDFVPLPHPSPSPLEERDTKGKSKRGFASLIAPFPLPLVKGKGDKGGWGLNKTKRGVM